MYHTRVIKTIYIEMKFHDVSELETQTLPNSVAAKREGYGY